MALCVCMGGKAETLIMGVINTGIDYFNTGVLTKAMEVVLTIHSMWNLRAKTKHQTQCPGGNLFAK